MSGVVPVHPYLTLPREQKDSIRAEFFNQVGDKKRFAQIFVSAAKQMQADANNNSSPTQPSPEVLELINKLDGKARELLERPAKEAMINGWKVEQLTITGLTYSLTVTQKGCFVGAVGAAGMGLLYRSQKVLAVANLCVACALFVFSSTSNKLKEAYLQVGHAINELTLDNCELFSQKIEQIYTDLEKASVVMRCYHKFQRRSLSKVHQAQELLREQLFPATMLKNIMTGKAPQSQPQGIEPNLAQIKLFFEKFEKISRKGMLLTSGIALLGAAWTYYAYLQRAYLMIVAGSVHFVVSSLIAKELFNLQRGAKKVYQAPDSEIAKTFAEIVPMSTVLSEIGIPNPTAYEIEQCVVIPFDAILTLVPGWKTRDN